MEGTETVNEEKENKDLLQSQSSSGEDGKQGVSAAKESADQDAETSTDTSESEEESEDGSGEKDAEPESSETNMKRSGTFLASSRSPPNAVEDSGNAEGSGEADTDQEAGEKKKKTEQQQQEHSAAQDGNSTDVQETTIGEEVAVKEKPSVEIEHAVSAQQGVVKAEEPDDSDSESSGSDSEAEDSSEESERVANGNHGEDKSNIKEVEVKNNEEDREGANEMTKDNKPSGQKTDEPLLTSNNDDTNKPNPKLEQEINTESSAMSRNNDKGESHTSPAMTDTGDIRTENQLLKSEVGNLKTLLDQTREEKKELLAMMKNVQQVSGENKKTLEQENHELKGEIKECRATLKQLEIENVALKEKVEELSNTKAKLEEVVVGSQVLHQTSQEAEAAKNKAVLDYSVLEEDYRRIKHENESLKQNKLEREEAISTLKNDLAQSVTDLLQVKNDKIKAEKALDDIKMNANNGKEREKEEEFEQLNAHISVLSERLKTVTESMTSLTQAVQTRQRENEALQQQLSSMQELNAHLLQQGIQVPSLPNNTSPSEAEELEHFKTAHRKLLMETKRLRELAAVRNTEEVHVSTQKMDTEKRMETAQKQLKAANRRIKQLEGWMDEIFNNNDYQLVLKENARCQSNSPGRSSREDVSLPDLTAHTVSSRLKHSYSKKARSPTRLQKAHDKKI